MNAADGRAVRQAKKKAKRDRQEELKDLADVLAMLAGRRMVWGLLSDAGVFRLSFAYESTQTTAFNEGKRSLGLKLMADIHELDPELYVQMAKEANQMQLNEPVTEEPIDE